MTWPRMLLAVLLAAVLWMALEMQVGRGPARAPGCGLRLSGGVSDGARAQTYSGTGIEDRGSGERRLAASIRDGESESHAEPGDSANWAEDVGVGHMKELIARTYPWHPDFETSEGRSAGLISKLPEQCSELETQALRELIRVWNQKVAESAAEIRRLIYEEVIRMVKAGDFGVYKDPAEAPEVLAREKRRKGVDGDDGIMTHYMPGSHRSENRVLVLLRSQLQPDLEALERRLDNVRAARRRDIAAAIREIEHRYR